MADIRTIGPTEAARRLRLRRLAPAEGLAAVRARPDRGESRGPTEADARAFARYLVEPGWLSEWGEAGRVQDDRRLAALLREVEELIDRRRPVDDRAGRGP